MGNRGLQGIQTVVERQQRVLANGNDDRFLLDGQHGGAGMLRPLPWIGHRAALPPIGYCLRADAMTTGQTPQAPLTMLYRSTY